MSIPFQRLSKSSGTNCLVLLSAPSTSSFSPRWSWITWPALSVSHQQPPGGGRCFQFTDENNTLGLSAIMSQWVSSPRVMLPVPWSLEVGKRALRVLSTLKARGEEGLKEVPPFEMADAYLKETGASGTPESWWNVSHWLGGAEEMDPARQTQTSGRRVSILYPTSATSQIWLRQDQDSFTWRCQQPTMFNA